MLQPNDKIIVALSGGKDSFTLLYNLFMIQKKLYNPKEIIALTIDEGIKDYRENCIKNALIYNVKSKRNAAPLPRRRISASG